RGLSSRERRRAVDERLEVRAVLLVAAAAVLVVHADQKRDEIVVGVGVRRVDRRGQLVGGPAGARDDSRSPHVQTAIAKHVGETDGPTVRIGDAFTDRVRIAEREDAKLGGGPAGRAETGHSYGCTKPLKTRSGYVRISPARKRLEEGAHCPVIDVLT